MLDVEYATAIATVICEENLSDKVRVLRFDGVRQLKGIAETYADKGYVERIITEIWLHKIPFVLNAKSKTEMKEILKPSKPRYDGGEFTSNSPYHSETEEMLLWSLTSLHAPLISAGFERYMSLFKKFFPNETKDILSA
jgi:hypothetical protein